MKGQIFIAVEIFVPLMTFLIYTEIKASSLTLSWESPNCMWQDVYWGSIRLH